MVLHIRNPFLFHKLPFFSLLFFFSVCFQEGGAIEKLLAERGKKTWEKNYLKAFSSFSALIFCTSLMQKQLFWKKKPLTKKKTGERCRAAGRGGHLTDKTRELCSRIPTVLYTELRDWSLQAEGGERREGRKVGEKERGRGGNSVQC